MPRKRAPTKSKNFPLIAFAPHLKKKGRFAPSDITKTITLGATVGVQFFSFSFKDVGGTGNLLPGFPVEISKPMDFPKDANAAIVFLAAFSAEYVDQSGNLVDHHLGQLTVNLALNQNNVVCTFLLRDSSVNEGVNMTANAVVLYFTGASLPK